LKGAIFAEIFSRNVERDKILIIDVAKVGKSWKTQLEN
jgi:hypothetical protein